MYQIPLSPFNQNFEIKVPVDENNIFLKIEQTYNSISNYWMWNIKDGNTNEYLICNLNLLTTDGMNNSNILNPYKYLRIGSAYVVPIDNESINAPNKDNIEKSFILVWGDNVP